MSFPLAKLLEVRINREQQATRHVEACRRKLATARALVVQRQNSLQAHTDRRRTRERELEQRHVGTRLTLAQLDEWQNTLLWMREQEAGLVAEITKAQGEVKNCEQVVTEAQSKRFACTRARQKVEMQKNLWQEQLDKLREQVEEREMEELVRPNVR